MNGGVLLDGSSDPCIFRLTAASLPVTRLRRTYEVGWCPLGAPRPQAVADLVQSIEDA